MTRRQDFPEFVQQSTQSVGLHDAKLQQLGTQAVQRQDRLLSLGLHRHETCIGLLRRRPDGTRVGRIGLVTQHEGPHAPGSQEPYIVAQLDQLACPPVGAAQASMATSADARRAK